MAIAISWLFLGYFLLLFAERVQSLVRMGADGALFPKKPFALYVNAMTLLSLAATVILLAFCNGGFWRSLFDGGVTPDYTVLSVTAGTLLISGMVHTEKTAAPVQFGAYGLLIVAMLLRTVTAAGEGAAVGKWFSLVYAVVFSMAIPVVYPSEIRHAGLFHCIEAVVSLVLVAVFTCMLGVLMNGGGADLLWTVPAAIVAVGDGAVLLLRRKESINYFVLIFAVLTLLLFAVGRIWVV